MDYSAMIESIMPFVSDRYNSTPFIVSHNNGEWFADFRSLALGDAEAQLTFALQTDPLALKFTGADFSSGSFPYVYDKVLLARLRAEYDIDKAISYSPNGLYALVEFMDEYINELSTEATEYLTTLRRPLLVLDAISSINLSGGIDEKKAEALIEQIEQHVQAKANLRDANNVSTAEAKRVIDGYTELNSFRLSGRLVILAEKEGADEPFMVCTGRWDNPLGVVEYDHIVLTPHHLDAVHEFVRREAMLLDFLESKRNLSGIPFQAFTASDCVPNGMREDMRDKIIVIKPEALSPEFRSAEHQIMLCTGGNGSRAEARGSAVFCTCLYSGEKSRFERYDVLGVADIAKLPEWALNKLSAIEAAKEPGAFEYGGYHFKPYRQFHEGEIDRKLKGDSRPEKRDMQYAMRNMVSDYELAFSKNGMGKNKWSHEDFYAAAGGACDADIFICFENGKLYVPTEGKLFRYKEPPQMEKHKTGKTSLLEQLEDAKSKAAEQNAEQSATKKRGDLEV